MMPIRGSDAGCHDHVAGYERRVEATRDAKADDSPATCLHAGVQQGSQPDRIAASHQSDDAGACGEPSFGCQSGDSQHRAPVQLRNDDGVDVALTAAFGGAAIGKSVLQEQM
jgi:hypothetical protein